jgi:hypothetical protein
MIVLAVCALTTSTLVFVGIRRIEVTLVGALGRSCLPCRRCAMLCPERRRLACGRTCWFSSGPNLPP